MTDPTATTTSGDVRGITRDGVHVFRSIPYAAPPVGIAALPAAAAGRAVVRRARRHAVRSGRTAEPVDARDDDGRGRAGDRRGRLPHARASSPPHSTTRSARSCSGSTAARSSSGPARSPIYDGTPVRRARRRRGRQHQLPPRRVRVPAPRRDLRGRVRRLGQPRHPRPGVRARVGARQHRRVRRRPRPRHDLRRVGRRDERRHAARAARRPRACSPRRSCSPAAAASAPTAETAHRDRPLGARRGRHRHRRRARVGADGRDPRRADEGARRPGQHRPGVHARGRRHRAARASGRRGRARPRARCPR